MTKDNAIKLALEALELAQDNLRDHGDNCFLHDEGEYNRCFCGKDSLSNHLQSVVEKLDEALAEQPAQQEQEPVALREAAAAALTSVYVCGRVWSAWHIGTMTEDDFSPASECDWLLDEIVHAVATAAPHPAQRTWVGLTDREKMMCRSYDIDEAIANTEAKLKEKHMTTQPEALRLAEIIGGDCAAELRRLHEENQAMLEVLKDLMDGTGDMTSERVEKARAAIAKGEQA